MNFCENFNAILLADDTQNNRRLLTRTRCKQWTCKYCAEVNRKQWNARIIDFINKHKDLSWSWFTVTAHSAKRGAKKSLENLRGLWEKLVKRIKRNFDGKIHYVRVFEKHKDGSYHIHCIISVHWTELKIRKSKDGKTTSHDVWLDKQIRELGGGFYSHAANFDGQHAGYIAGYVSKYMTKLDADYKAELGRIRHIQTSQGWDKLESESELEWQMKSGYYERDLIDDIKLKRPTVDIQTGEMMTYDVFDDSYVYPKDFK